MNGKRIYPRNRVACVVVWLLDRLPSSVRREVLSSYWSQAELDTVKTQGAELWRRFGKGRKT